MHIKSILILIWFNTIVNAQSLTRSEPYRPQVHYSPAKAWMNDPNGLVYYKGEYHLFYQFYPDATVWGPMHWAHAVSKDLIHWDDLPLAIKPDKLGWIFSGSAVIDHQNSSGLGKKGEPPMIAIYTYHNDSLARAGRIDFQYQGLAFSHDTGRTWTKYAKNPILKNPGIIDFRDPKVSWDAIHKKWIMALAVKDHVEFYGSRNLIDWAKLSEFGKLEGSHLGVWECPDLFPLEINGATKWVLTVSVGNGAPNGGSGTQYFVGDFDGKKFKTNSPSTKWLDYGKDNYAAVSFNDAPTKSRLFIGWLNNWSYANDIPTSSWRGATTLPRYLDLVKIKNEFYLKSTLIGLEGLYGKSRKIEPQQLNGQIDLDANPSEPLEINIQVEEAKNFELILENSKGERTKIGQDDQGYYVNNLEGGWDSLSKRFAEISRAPFLYKENKQTFQIIIDRSSVELFTENGLVSMTNQLFPSAPFTKIFLKGKAKRISGNIYELKSIWK